MHAFYVLHVIMLLFDKLIIFLYSHKFMVSFDWFYVQINVVRTISFQLLPVLGIQNASAFICEQKRPKVYKLLKPRFFTLINAMV